MAEEDESEVLPIGFEEGWAERERRESMVRWSSCFAFCSSEMVLSRDLREWRREVSSVSVFERSRLSVSCSCERRYDLEVKSFASSSLLRRVLCMESMSFRRTPICAVLVTSRSSLWARICFNSSKEERDEVSWLRSVEA